MKKRIIFKTFTLVFFIFAFSFTNVNGLCKNNNFDYMYFDTQHLNSSKYEIVPFADIIEIRYKKINGKHYYRKYNATKDEWIGPWILLG